VTKEEINKNLHDGTSAKAPAVKRSESTQYGKYGVDSDRFNPGALAQSDHAKSCLSLPKLDPNNIPSHVAIIADGNRRWAKRNLLNIAAGHRAGADTATNLVIDAKKIGIKTVTIFVFSTENWKRSEWEISTLIHLLDEMLKKELPNMKKEGVAFHTIGELSRFPASLQETIRQTKEETKEGKEIDFILALNYGGRDELTRAMSKIVDGVLAGRIDKNGLTEQLIQEHLDTASFKDPELIIRTSGEMRTSNFLLWQNCYSEFVLIDKFWPEFTREDLIESVRIYQGRDRRKGGGS